MGHCLGLWHTHHGVSETSGCADMCYENAHSRTDANADFVGDFCKDTMPTPTNYYCSAPGGTDCNGSSWGATDTGNFMGYAPDSCYDHFSDEQASRMHCWSRDMLPGLIITQSCSDPVPSAPSSLTATASGSYGMNLSWSDNSNNEDGFTVTRNGSVVANLGANTTSYGDSGLNCETSYNYAVYAGNCGGDSGSATAVGTTGTCPAATAVHVGAIDMSVSGNKRKTASASILIVDAGGSPISGASVSGAWSGTTSGSASGTTGSDGRVSFTSSNTRNSSYCWTFTVSNVSGTGLTYNAGANVMTSNSAGNACAGRVVYNGTIDWAEQDGLSGGSTRIAFNLLRNADVTLDVYDVRGHLVRRLVDGSSMSGENSVTWNGSTDSGQRASAGTYLFRLNAGGEVVNGRVLLVK